MGHMVGDNVRTCPDCGKKAILGKRVWGRVPYSLVRSCWYCNCGYQYYPRLQDDNIEKWSRINGLPLPPLPSTPPKKPHVSWWRKVFGG